MPETRDWFKKHLSQFKERETSTPVNGTYYITVGRLVPRSKVLKEIPTVKVIDLKRCNKPE